MQIEISPLVAVGLISGIVGPTVGFVIYTKTQISLLRQAIENSAHIRHEDMEKSDKKDQDIKVMIGDLARKVDGYQFTVGQQLYDLNTKITRAEALAEVHNKK